MGTGYLKINTYTAEHALPVPHVRVLVKDENNNILYDIVTDENGNSESLPLYAPAKETTLSPTAVGEKFASYNVEVPATRGFKRVMIYGVQIFDTVETELPIEMHPAVTGESEEKNTDVYLIPKEHGVDMPGRRFTQQKIKTFDTDPQTRALPEPLSASNVLIPKYITVHLGSPNNTAARNVRVPFDEYIKNVASSEIFPTWNENALYANILAQISFALNRINTAWYRSRGFEYDITNSTAFDQAFVEGRGFFANISKIVDGIFNVFLRRAGRREPLFAQYCNGTTVTCSGLSQWGSQALAEQGYTAEQIIKNYYPADTQIVESNNFTTKEGTYGGVPLQEGSSGNDVRLMQVYLNRISGNYYMDPIGFPTGYFGTLTKNSTTQFQKIMNLIPDGIIGKGTWYSITKIYTAVKQLAELYSEGERVGIGLTPPTQVLELGARGANVAELQFLLNFIGEFYNSVPFVVENGVFRDETKRSVIEFQKTFGLPTTGVVANLTWNKLYEVYHSIINAIELPPTVAFPGVLRYGSQNNYVLILQNALNAIAAVNNAIPSINIVPEGIFGPMTQASVIAFQRLFGLPPDGIVNKDTWDRIFEVYQSIS